MIELLLLLAIVACMLIGGAYFARTTAAPVYVPVRVRDRHIRRR